MNQSDKQSVLRQFGSAVRAHRNVLKISQEELAFRAELDRTYISSVERGERNVSLFNVIRLASALEIPPAELFIGINFTLYPE